MPLFKKRAKLVLPTLFGFTQLICFYGAYLHESDEDLIALYCENYIGLYKKMLTRLDLFKI